MAAEMNLSVPRSTFVMSKTFTVLKICRMVILVCTLTIILCDWGHSPMQCLQKKPEKAINTYCYIHSTFTVNNTLEERAYPFADAFYPGVGPITETSTRVWQKYYFWLPYLLALSFFIFWLPSHLWDSLEGNFVKQLTDSFSGFDTIEQSSDYFVISLHEHNHRAARFLFCEVLGIASIITNILVTNWYLDGRFLHDIPKALTRSSRVNEIDEAFDKIFPKVTKCTFSKFGYSGTVEKKDLLCILTRNLLTGRIYLLLFIVFLISLVISGVSFIMRIAACLSPKLRVNVLQQRAPTRGRAKEDIRFILKFCDVGDWFLLLHMFRSMPSLGEWLVTTRKKLQDPKMSSLRMSLQQQTLKERQNLYCS